MNIPITYLTAAIAALSHDNDPIEASRLIRLAQIHLTSDFVHPAPAIPATVEPSQAPTFSLEPCPPLRRTVRGLLARWS
jgi:hypothetical protein